MVRGQLGGVKDDPGTVRVGGVGQLPYGPQLTGDVGGAGDADEGRALAPLNRCGTGGEGLLKGGHGLLGVRGASR